MRLLSLLAATALALSLLAPHAQAQAADKPYELEVWADASYAASGELEKLTFPQQKDYPAAFIENLRTRITAREYTPRQVEGQPASFETGIKVTLTVTPGAGGGSVSVDAIEELPRVLRMTKVQYTEDLSRSSAWDGVLLARCTVTAKGRCSNIEVAKRGELAADAALRFAKATLQGWRFQPQRVNGKAIETVMELPITVETVGLDRPEFRDRSL